MQEPSSQVEKTPPPRRSALVTRAIAVASSITGATSLALCAQLVLNSEAAGKPYMLHALLAASLAAVGMAGTAVMLRRLLQPIADLVDAASKLAKGDAKVRATVTGHAEFGTLASFLNRIAERLDEAEQASETLVAAQTRQLRRTNAQLVRASEMKSEFLANMSHEIRTPLNGIIGFADLLAEEDLTQEQAGYASTIAQCGGTLLELINDILDLTKVETGRLSVEEGDVDLESLLDEVSASVKQRAMVKGVEYRVRIPGGVPKRFRTDGARLRQVLINLAGNAVKFTSKGSVQVRIMLLDAPPKSLQNRPETDWLSFAVEDTGIGIPEDRLQAIFDPFVQADGSTTRQFGGTGLGLAISKRLMELLGGTIEVTSARGKGSRFSAILPYRPADQLQPSAPEPVEEPSRITRPFSFGSLPATVLLIEDNDKEAAALATSLAQRGITVYRHHRRYGCEELCSALMPDAILLDPALPDGTGFEVLDGLRAAEATADIPVLLCCENSINGRAEKYRRVQVLQKPITDGVLLQALRTACDQAEQNVRSSEPNEARGSQTQSRAPAPVKRSRILLVEDVPANRKLIRRILEKIGHSVIEAVNGQEALDQLEACDGHIDLILMDMQMPVMSGYEATRRIKEHCTWREIPVIALTAHAMAGDREKCISAGCDDYLTKPVKRSTLALMLEQHLRGVGHATAQAPS